MAWDAFRLRVLRHKVGEQALVAGMGPLRIIEIDATGRVLKNGCRSPRSTHRPAVAALLQEIEFELENLQNIALIIRHSTASAGRFSTTGSVRLDAIVGQELIACRDSSHTAV